MNIRTLSVLAISAIGAGILGFLFYSIRPGASSLEAGGWIAAGFLALRDVLSKITQIVLGRAGDAVSIQEPDTPA